MARISDLADGFNGAEYVGYAASPEDALAVREILLGMGYADDTPLDDIRNEDWKGAIGKVAED